jgi:hypothetical protein
MAPKYTFEKSTLKIGDSAGFADAWKRQWNKGHV